ERRRRAADADAASHDLSYCERVRGRRSQPGWDCGHRRRGGIERRLFRERFPGRRRWRIRDPGSGGIDAVAAKFLLSLDAVPVGFEPGWLPRHRGCPRLTRRAATSLATRRFAARGGWWVSHRGLRVSPGYR